MHKKLLVYFLLGFLHLVFSETLNLSKKPVENNPKNEKSLNLAVNEIPSGKKNFTKRHTSDENNEYPFFTEQDQFIDGVADPTETSISYDGGEMEGDQPTPEQIQKDIDQMRQFVFPSYGPEIQYMNQNEGIEEDQYKPEQMQKQPEQIRQLIYSTYTPRIHYVNQNEAKPDKVQTNVGVQLSTGKSRKGLVREEIRRNTFPGAPHINKHNKNSVFHSKGSENEKGNSNRKDSKGGKVASTHAVPNFSVAPNPTVPNVNISPPTFSPLPIPIIINPTLTHLGPPLPPPNFPNTALSPTPPTSFSKPHLTPLTHYHKPHIPLPHKNPSHGCPHHGSIIPRRPDSSCCCDKELVINFNSRCPPCFEEKPCNRNCILTPKIPLVTPCSGEVPSPAFIPSPCSHHHF